jgi:hypothetical protein
MHASAHSEAESDPKSLHFFFLAEPLLKNLKTLGSPQQSPQRSNVNSLTKSFVHMRQTESVAPTELPPK